MNFEDRIISIYCVYNLIKWNYQFIMFFFLLIFFVLLIIAVFFLFSIRRTRATLIELHVEVTITLFCMSNFECF